MVVGDLREKGISPVYLITNHVGFYERYGWEFLCMVQGDDEPEMTRMYIHRQFYNNKRNTNNNRNQCFELFLVQDIDSLIIDGEADSFALELYPELRPQWLFGISEKRINEFWKNKYKDIVLRTDVDYVTYMFGNKTRKLTYIADLR